MKQEITLLMTASISPTVAKANLNPKFRHDVATRLNDYKQALQHWLGYTRLKFDHIVFVDNSGYDLTELKELVAANNPKGIHVEFLQCAATPLPQGIHYGYSELEMIDYAFENSEAIKHSDYVVKVTGRLFFPKVASLFNRMPKGFKIAIDSRDYKLGKYSNHFIVTTMFVVQKAFYNQLLKNAKAGMTPHKISHAEKVYYQILKPLYLQKQPGIIIRLPFTMHPVGVGAHWNNNYNSTKNRLMARLRDVARVVLPNFWI